MSSKRVSLRAARIGSLIMAWIFGVLGGSFGLNALIKSSQQKSKLRQTALPTIVKIDTHDITRAGVTSTVACALIGVLASLFLLFAFVPKLNRRSTLKFERIALLVATQLLFASLIPFTIYFATKSAKIDATLGNVIIPQAVVDKTAEALGQTRVYKDIDYIRWAVYVQWFTFLFAMIATIVTFMASRGSESCGPSTGPSSPDSQGDLTNSEGEKSHAKWVP